MGLTAGMHGLDCIRTGSHRRSSDYSSLDERNHERNLQPYTEDKSPVDLRMRLLHQDRPPMSCDWRSHELFVSDGQPGYRMGIAHLDSVSIAARPRAAVRPTTG